ncbi:hypothetical protein LCGC14_1555820 [marine sediment metagenome]|uniref:Uncharacterized protein n=1 Tax=marine sediment metagenome TaxID=412755 RepID=A0A0F9LPT0_9ZZZZ
MKETEFQKVKDDLSYIKKTLAGNGEEGLIKQTQKQTEAIIKIQSYNHLKNWILGSAVTVLATICGSLATFILFN